MKKIITTALLLLISLSSLVFSAGRTSSTTVRHIRPYTVNHKGGILVEVNGTTASGVAGFWLNPEDPGFNTTYSVLMLAFQTETPVQITYYTADYNYGNRPPHTNDVADDGSSHIYYAIKDVRMNK